MAVLALAMPREDGFLIPERRDYLGWLRRLLPGARRRREEEAGAEADRYVTDLRTDKDQSPMTIRADQLPSTQRVYRAPLMSPPSILKPPWQEAEDPARSRGPATAPQESPVYRRRAPGDPPTIVIEIMRPAIEGDLGNYLARLPGYPDDDALSARGPFVPRASLALGPPDHDGPPQDVQGDQGDEDDLAPLQRGVPDVEHQEEPGGEQAPRDRQLQHDGVPSPPALVPGPEEPGDDREQQ
jgi:hypothetical protein